MSFWQLNAKQGKVIDKTAEVRQSGRIRIPPGDGTSVLDVDCPFRLLTVSPAGAFWRGPVCLGY